MVLENDDILLLMDDKWEATPTLEHKWALHWAKAGNRVLWIEKPKGIAESGWLRGFASGGGKPREQAANVWSVPMISNAPLAHTGTLPGRALKGLHNPLYLARVHSAMEHLEFRPRFLILFQQMAYRWNLIPKIPHELSIYYNLDIFGFGQATAAQFEEERRCAEKVDLIFATSVLNRRRLEPFNPNTFFIPHAVDLAWWDRERHRIPLAYESIPRPRVVFTGKITAHFDFNLIGAVARQNPAVNFVILGRVEGRASAEEYERVGLLPNVHLLGFQPLETIPGFMAGADVLMFPYIRTVNTVHAGGALKLYEYFLTGKPVLATPFTDFEPRDEALITVADTAEQWTAALNALLKNAEADRRKSDARIERARENTYDNRLALQREAITRVLDARR